MNAASEKRKFGTWLFDPFTYIAGWQSLLLGFSAILAAGYIGSFTKTHFDGVLDMHSGRPAPLWIFLSEGMIDWLLLGILLFVFGKVISKTQFRPLDLFGTQAMARWPTIVSALAITPGAVHRVGLYILEYIRNPSGTTPPNPADIAVFSMCTLAVILMTCWFVALAYRSYSVSCNVKGGRAIATFMAAILIAEILSKISIAIILGRL
jgi:hypothetical protein